MEMEPWEDDEDWWKGGNPFISLIVGKNYKLSEPRIIDCLWVKKMNGLVPVLNEDYHQYKKKFRKVIFLGVSSDCDWLPDEMMVQDEKKIKEVDFGVFVGIPKGEEENYLFFAKQVEDDEGTPLFWECFD